MIPIVKFLFVRVEVDFEKHWGSPVSPQQCPPLMAAGSEQYRRIQWDFSHPWGYVLQNIASSDGNTST